MDEYWTDPNYPINEPPIMYYPDLVGLMGNPQGALFLSLLIAWWQDGDFSKTDADIRDMTRLSAGELRRAKRTLKALGFATLTVRGLPATTHYALDEDRFLTALHALREQQSLMWEQYFTIKEARRVIQNNYPDIFAHLGNTHGFSCQHCAATENLHIDHKHPVSKGGTNALANLQLLCGSCNSRKGARVEREDA